MALNPVLQQVTEAIVARSKDSRQAYLERIARAAEQGPARAHLTCGNQAHAYAAMGPAQDRLAEGRAPNLGIVTAYNDMLSAHQPFERFPALIKQAAAEAGPPHRWPAACLPCATGSPKGRRGWNCRFFPAT
ncbi:Phosphogluconate dehydratase [Rhodovulum sp. P5]|nr:Phosphogluconate dehydratase [Rhodovulum sp. P5]